MLLITGATGFVGRHLANELALRNIPFRGASRTAVDGLLGVGPLSGTTDWQTAVVGSDTVVHLAAVNENVVAKGAEDCGAYDTVNVEATAALARQAAAAGVKRFVFLSTVKVNGETSQPGVPFSSFDGPMPATPYARSKHRAEQGLVEIAGHTGMDLVILRPPLVYGRGSKGSFNGLVSLVRKGWPLPLGAIDNRRSMIYVENLCDLIITVCLAPRENEQSAPSIAMASDGFTISTAGLVRMIASAIDRKILMPAVPKGVIRMLGKVSGKDAIVDRLLENLEIVDDEVKCQFNWSPKWSAEEAIVRSI